MKFLVDQNLSSLVARRLSEAGHDAIHARDVHLERAPDGERVALAAAEGRVILSADADFGTILSGSGASTPSGLLLRGGLPQRPGDQSLLILANLPRVAEDLERGALVVIEPGRIRVRTSPIG